MVIAAKSTTLYNSNKHEDTGDSIVCVHYYQHVMNSHFSHKVVGQIGITSLLTLVRTHMVTLEMVFKLIPLGFGHQHLTSTRPRACIIAHNQSQEVLLCFKCTNALRRVWVVLHARWAVVSICGGHLER